MKKSKLTFNDFRGLDFKTTQETVAFTGKPNDVGFEEAYALVKKGVFHPLPDFQQIGTSSGRLFNVGNDLYLMETTGIKKRNGTAFASFITQTFANNHTYRNIKPFFEVISTGAITPGTIDVVGDQFIRYSTTLPTNKYVGKHLIISAGLTHQTLYITGNDENTIYLDGMISGDIIDSGVTATGIYDKTEILAVYDGDSVYRYKKDTGASYGVAITAYEGFIEVFANRLFVMAGYEIKFSTFLSATFKNQNNNIDTEGIIKDTQIIGNSLVVFTTKGTYAVTGTGYTTMNFPKISEFSPFERVYPISHIDNIYVSHEGYIRRFTTSEGLLQTQYNYALIPDTQREIFSIERGIIFSLGHGSNKYGILNVEELQNRRIITITNFRDENIQDMIEFKGTIFIISGGKIYKENGYRNIKIKTNKIRAVNKLYRDMVTMTLSGTYPATINVTHDTGTKVSAKNTYANQTSYNIKEKSYNIQVEITADNPISDFNIYYIV